MADGGTLTSSSSKDTWQQEPSNHSVDQDTSAQGVYLTYPSKINYVKSFYSRHPYYLIVII